MNATMAATASATFLRWQGSKRAQAAFITSLIPTNTVRYIEPFMGSAAVFFSARPSLAVLADTLRPLVRTFMVVRDAPLELARTLETLAGEAAFYEVRERSHESTDPVTEAAQFVFLNSYCYNGLYRTNRLGRFNVPVGTRAPGPPSSRKIEEASRRLQGATIYEQHAFESLKDAGPRDFIYMDPPHPSPEKLTESMDIIPSPTTTGGFF